MPRDHQPVKRSQLRRAPGLEHITDLRFGVRRQLDELHRVAVLPEFVVGWRSVSMTSARVMFLGFFSVVTIISRIIANVAPLDLTNVAPLTILYPCSRRD